MIPKTIVIRKYTSAKITPIRTPISGPVFHTNSAYSVSGKISVVEMSTSAIDGEILTSRRAINTRLVRPVARNRMTRSCTIPVATTRDAKYSLAERGVSAPTAG